MFQKIKEWLTNQQYPTAAQKNATAKVAPPLFMQRSPVQQEKILQQRLRDCQQLLQRTEIERDEARRERDDEVKKRKEAGEDRRQAWRKWESAARVAIFTVLTLVFFVTVCAVSGSEKNVLANHDRQYSIALATQSGESHPSWRRNFKTAVVTNRTDNWLSMESNKEYSLECYVLDYNYDICQADICLKVSAAWEAGEAGFATLVMNLGDQDLAFEQLTLSSSVDMSIADIVVTHSSYIETEPDDSERIEQYLEDHDMGEKLDSQFAERLWHFVIKIKTGTPKYATTFKTNGLPMQGLVAVVLFICMLVAAVITAFVSIGWEYKYKYSDIYEDDDYSHIFYDKAVSEEEFVVKLEAYLQDYYASESTDEDEPAVTRATTENNEKPT